MNTIDPRIHQVLDGELPAEALPEELRRVAAQIAAAADLLAAPPAQAGASLESRVMARIRRPPPSRVRRMLDWLVTPHALVLRFRPAWSLAFVVLVVALHLLSAGDAWQDIGTCVGSDQVW